VNSEIITADCTGCGARVKRMLESVRHIDGWRSHVVCGACREAEDPSAERFARLIREDSESRWRAKVEAFDASAGYVDARLPDEPEQAWQRVAVDALDVWCEPGPRPARAGLMLVGPTGIGKTWAAFAVANEAARRGNPSGIRVASELDLLGAQVAPWELRDHVGRWVDGASVLLIDDIGVAARQQDQIQAGWKALCDLIAGQNRPLLLLGTSNRQSWQKEGGLVSWMGQQSASRLRPWMRICTTGVVDRRTGETHANWERQLGGAS